MAFSECDHPACKEITYVAMDAFLSGPGEMVLVRVNRGEICIRKRQGELGKFNKGIKTGSVGIFADLLTRCSKHATGKLPENWLDDNIDALPDGNNVK